MLYQHDTQLGTERFEIRERSPNRRVISTHTRLNVGDFSAWRNQRLLTDRKWRALSANALWSMEGESWRSRLRRVRGELVEVTEGGDEGTSQVTGMGVIYLGDSSIAHFTPFCDLDAAENRFTVFPGIEVTARRAGWVVGEGGSGEKVRFAHVQVNTPDQTLDVLCQDEELILVLVPALDLIAVRDKIGVGSETEAPEGAPSQEPEGAPDRAEPLDRDRPAPDQPGPTQL